MKIFLTKTKFVNVRLTEKVLKELAKVADSSGMPVSTYVRHLIVKSLPKKKTNETRENIERKD